jgi:hypothetical protein
MTNLENHEAEETEVAAETAVTIATAAESHDDNGSLGKAGTPPTSSAPESSLTEQIEPPITDSSSCMADGTVTIIQPGKSIICNNHLID